MKIKLMVNKAGGKLFYKRPYRIGTALGTVVGATLIFFQNCSQPGSIELKGTSSTNSSLSEPLPSNPDPQSPIAPNPPSTPGGVCMGVSCDLTPLTYKPAVTTILLALGDEANNQLVINGASSQLIAETVIRYTSPKTNPKILIVQDYNIDGEDPEDTRYVAEVLLKRYDTHLIVESKEGLSAQDVAGYDLVWYNNPGHPMSNIKSRDTLLAFKGGVVLQGDDLARGANFSLESLTRLKYIDNGTSVNCAGQEYSHDNNADRQFSVSLVDKMFPASSESQSFNFKYGNDIDNTTLLEGVEVLATALGGHESCTEKRPAIVRYFKEMANP